MHEDSNIQNNEHTTMTTTDSSPSAATTTDTSPSAATTKERSFDEVLQSNRLYQAEFDRRISKALDTAKGKWEQDTTTRIEAAKTEAEKLSRMTAEQRSEHEQKSRESNLARRESELTRRELRATAADTLRERGLPMRLLDTLSFYDAATCATSIDATEAAFRGAVESGVTERLRGTTPRSNAPTSPKSHIADVRAAMGLDAARVP